MGPHRAADAKITGRSVAWEPGEGSDWWCLRWARYHRGDEIGTGHEEDEEEFSRPTGRDWGGEAYGQRGVQTHALLGNSECESV